MLSTRWLLCSLLLFNLLLCFTIADEFENSDASFEDAPTATATATDGVVEEKQEEEAPEADSEKVDIDVRFNKETDNVEKVIVKEEEIVFSHHKEGDDEVFEFDGQAQLQLSEENIRIELWHDQVNQFRDPGWEIVGHNKNDNDNLQVSYILPHDMKAGRRGEYIIEYTLFDQTTGQGFGDAKYRKVLVKECYPGKAGYNCNANSTCIKDPELFPTLALYYCKCLAGYEGYDGYDGFHCQNINECNVGTHNCPAHSKCVDLTPGFKCICDNGFEKGDNGNCVDINECERGEHDCHSEGGVCINTEGSYSCKCKEGWRGNGRYCVRINKCAENNDCHPNLATCTTDFSQKGYHCTCKRGYEGNGVTCTDINECETGAHNCASPPWCVNNPGSYECVDNCEGFKCPPHSTCSNERRGAVCKCNAGFEKVLSVSGNDMHCKDIEKPSITLLGDNPFTIEQYEQYIEPGFIAKDNGGDKVRQWVSYKNFPSTNKCGNFTIKYSAQDEANLTASATRNIIVTPVDRCAIPRDDPHGHNCHVKADCVFIGCDEWKCICRKDEGYGDKPGTPEHLLGRMCVDVQSPVVMAEPVLYINECLVCQQSMGFSGDPKQPHPDANLRYKDNITPEHLLKTSFESVKINDTYYIHHYRAQDEAGNIGEATVPVYVTKEDLRELIKEMKVIVARHNDEYKKILEEEDSNYKSVFETFQKEYKEKVDKLSANENNLQKQTQEFDANLRTTRSAIDKLSYIYRLLGILLAVVAVMLLILFISKAYLLYTVTYFTESNKPTWSQFRDAWSFWLRIVHPQTSESEINQMLYKRANDYNII